eukprot:9502460-Pyramimonas_sp.AAC.1
MPPHSSAPREKQARHICRCLNVHVLYKCERKKVSMFREGGNPGAIVSRTMFVRLEKGMRRAGSCCSPDPDAAPEKVNTLIL